jgi:hypothetical protein
VRSRAGAAIGVVAESVDVHSTLSVGVVAADVPCDLGVGGLVLLLKRDGALDVGVSTENGDYNASLAVAQSLESGPEPLVSVLSARRRSCRAQKAW